VVAASLAIGIQGCQKKPNKTACDLLPHARDLDSKDAAARKAACEHLARHAIELRGLKGTLAEQFYYSSIPGQTEEGRKNSGTLRRMARCLTPLLEDRDKLVRLAAADALGKVGRHASPAVPALVAVARKGGELESAALRALASIGPGATPALRAMLHLARDSSSFEDRYRRKAALRVVGRIRHTGLKALIGLAHGDDEKLAEAALEAIEDLGTSASGALKLVAPLVKHKQVTVRRAAASCLANLCATGMGSFKKVALCDRADAAAVAPQIAVALDDPDGAVRAGAALAVGNLGLHGAELRAKLARILQKDTYTEARQNAARSLGWEEERAKDALPALAAAVNDPDVTVRMHVLNTLYRVKDREALSFPGLLKVLRSSEEDSRNKALAIAAMRWMGHKARGAFELVKPQLHAEDEELREVAVRVLPLIHPKGFDSLLTCAQDAREAKETRRYCAGGLRLLGPDRCREAVKALTRVANNRRKPGQRRVAAIWVMGYIGERAPDSALLALAPLQKDADAKIRAAARAAVQEIRRDTERAAKQRRKKAKERKQKRRP
jgi:HEAT repeat protein